MPSSGKRDAKSTDRLLHRQSVQIPYFCTYPIIPEQVKKNPNKTEQWPKVPAPAKLVSIQRFLSDSLKLTVSLLKMTIQSKKASRLVNPTPFDEVVVLGNGPSAKDFLEQKQDFMKDKAILAVNFFALHERFTQVKPSLYVLADPAFFMREDDAGILDVIKESVDWDFLLMIPSYAKKHAIWRKKQALLSKNPCIGIAYYNMTKVDGPEWFVQRATLKGWGLPAPHNVLVPSIANCLRIGFRNIYVAGADHSWIKQLWVNENNEVLLDDKHCYDNGSKETVRKSAPLYRILLSFSMVLQSYGRIDRVARKLGTGIYNITPGSYIDVFARLKI